MDWILKRIDKVILAFGKIAMICSLLLIVVIGLDVVQRYLFKNTYNWIIELEWYLFSLVFLFGAAWTFQNDKHVRVDVLYQRFTEKQRSVVNIFGHIFLLLPWTIVCIKTSLHYANNSFYIQENSPNPGGLPALYLIKYAIVVGFVLLLLQTIIMAIREFTTLSKLLWK